MPDRRPNFFPAGFRRRKFPAIFFLLPFLCLILIGLAWVEVAARVEREYQIEVDAIYRESDNMIRSFEDHARFSITTSSICPLKPNPMTNEAALAFGHLS